MTQQLEGRHGAQVIKTRQLIKTMRPETRDERAALQRAGEALDKHDGGKWVATALARLIADAPKADQRPTMFVVDSVRIRGQIDAVRAAFNMAVHHIHLTASRKELARRFAARPAKFVEPTSYEELTRSRTERNVEQLAELADIVVETDRCTEDAVFVRATALLGLYPRTAEPVVDVIVGGQYGSEGKGNIVGHVAPEYQLLVRVGGPNAGHKVYGQPVEVYHHIPSGATRAPEARLLLAAGAVLNVKNLLKEVAEHRISAERLSIDPNAMVIETADIKTEKRLLKRISSTMQGVGAATARKILHRIPRGRNKVTRAKDLKELRPFIRDAQSVLETAYVNGDRVLLEGTQGTSLSLHHGPYPYVTSRDTTVSGCLADAGIAPKRVRKIVMVCRTFPIRVGGPSGHMDHEIKYSELARRSGIPVRKLRRTEKTTTTNRQRRIAEFDWAQLKRSSLLNGPTDLALTFADYINVDNQRAFRFEQLNEQTLRFIEEVERVSGVPVSMISKAFDWRNVIDRRAW